MGRPKGSSPRPGSKKPGRKAGATKLRESFTHEEMLAIKAKMLGLIESGEVSTIRSAAQKVGISPVKAYAWTNSDRDFQSMLRLAREVYADMLEEELRTHNNFIPKMFILKAYRPEFRDNYKIELHNEKLEGLLTELRQIAARQTQQLPDPSVEGETIESSTSKEVEEIEES